MKFNQKTKALLSMAGIVLSASMANAAPTSGATTDQSTTNADLILSVIGNQGGTPVDLEFDLGLASTAFTSLDGSVVNLTSTVRASDLNTTFGSTWFSGGTLKWGVVGSTLVSTGRTQTVTVFATSPGSSAGTASPLQNNSVGNLGQAEQPIAGIYSGLSSASNANGNTSAAILSQSTATSYTGEGGSSTSSYNTNAFTLGAQVDGQLGGSSGAQVLDLYKLTPGSGPGTLLGTFTFSSASPTTDSVVFTSVPEPSTYVMFSLGAIGLVILARRRRQSNIA